MTDSINPMKSKRLFLVRHQDEGEKEIDISNLALVYADSVVSLREGLIRNYAGIEDYPSELCGTFGSPFLPEKRGYNSERDISLMEIYVVDAMPISTIEPAVLLAAYNDAEEARNRKHTAEFDARRRAEYEELRKVYGPGREKYVAPGD